MSRLPTRIARNTFNGGFASCPSRLVAKAPSPARHGSLLTADRRDWILRADTLFVASAHPGQGADASHRGGRPGFVQIPHPQTLRIPDYPGNNTFNTLGNFENYPHAGLALSTSSGAACYSSPAGL